MLAITKIIKPYKIRSGNEEKNKTLSKERLNKNLVYKIIPKIKLTAIKQSPTIALTESATSKVVPVGLKLDKISRQKISAGIKVATNRTNKIFVHFFISLFFARILIVCNLKVFQIKKCTY